MFLEVLIKQLSGDPLTGDFVAGRKIHTRLSHLSVHAERALCGPTHACPLQALSRCVLRMYLLCSSHSVIYTLLLK